MKVNTLGSGHTLTSLAQGFKPFDPKDGFHQKCLALVFSALILMKTKSWSNPKCNVAFQDLPQKRKFDDVFSDDSIWINLVELDAVMGQQFGNDVAVSKQAFSDALKRNDGVDFIASILVHELAHVNGATMNDNKAESILPPCGFAAYYNPHSHDKPH